jgi:hypothetical protein
MYICKIIDIKYVYFPLYLMAFCKAKLYDPSNYILVVNQSFVITGFPEPLFCSVRLSIQDKTNILLMSPLDLQNKHTK